jgi:hypothetical protein
MIDNKLDGGLGNHHAILHWRLNSYIFLRQVDLLSAYH